MSLACWRNPCKHMESMYISHIAAWSHLCPLPGLTMSSSFFLSIMFLQVLQNVPYFGDADYYSLGVIVYVMEVDGPPFLTSKEPTGNILKIVTTVEPDHPEDMDNTLCGIMESVSIHRAFAFLKDKVLCRLHTSK